MTEPVRRSYGQPGAAGPGGPVGLLRSAPSGTLGDRPQPVLQRDSRGDPRALENPFRREHS